MGKSTGKQEIRNKLLENGYPPLPLSGKACYIKGWSQADIDSDWLKSHARTADTDNTGIRCDDLVAFDIDVDSQRLADKVDHCIEKIAGRSNFCRWSGDTGRRLMLYWAETPGRKQRTAKYGAAAQLEVLSGSGCQFAAYGMHPKGHAYHWDDGPEPVKNGTADLPVVTDTQVTDILIAVEQLFIDHGLLKATDDHGSGASSAEYDLTPDMVFEVVKPSRAAGQYTVAELEVALAGGSTWNVNLTAFRPDSDSGAGLVSLDAHGRVFVHDLVTAVTHYQAPEVPAGLPDMQAPDDGNLFVPTPEDELQRLIAEYVYVWDGTVRLLADPSRTWRLERWNQAHKQRLPRGKANPPMYTLWLADCIKAAVAQLCPDTTDRLLERHGITVLNTYKPPAHDAKGGDTATFHAFLQHLVPDRIERALVLNWIATKLQHPEYRLHGILMVARGVFGTGRGTLVAVLNHLLGPQYCTETTLGHLTGGSGQAQYNDYMSQSLLVSVPEALEEKPKQGAWITRHQAYEQIKTCVDTTAVRTLIVRKGQDNTAEDIYASVLICTNHDDALVIPAHERRLIIVSNATVPLADVGQLADDVYTWMGDPANIAALYHELKQWDTSKYDPYGTAPDTAAKDIMISLGDSGPDEAWKIMLEQTDGDLITLAQWRSMALRIALEYELDWPEQYNQEKVLRVVFRKNSQGLWPNQPRRQLAAGKARVRPRIIRNPGHWLGNQNRDEIRSELVKNGPAGGEIIAFTPKDTEK